MINANFEQSTSKSAIIIMRPTIDLTWRCPACQDWWSFFVISSIPTTIIIAECSSCRENAKVQEELVKNLHCVSSRLCDHNPLDLSCEKKSELKVLSSLRLTVAGHWHNASQPCQAIGSRDASLTLCFRRWNRVLPGCSNTSRIKASSTPKNQEATTLKRPIEVEKNTSVCRKIVSIKTC